MTDTRATELSLAALEDEPPENFGDDILLDDGPQFIDSASYFLPPGPGPGPQPSAITAAALLAKLPPGQQQPPSSSSSSATVVAAIAAGGNLALARAVYAGDVRAAREALSAGADPNTRFGEEQVTMTMVAAAVIPTGGGGGGGGGAPQSGGQADTTSETLVRTLAAFGADLDALCAAGKAALHRAVACGRPNILTVTALIECGATVDLGDLRGMTALTHAAAAGNVEAARALLQRGANPNAKDRESATPLHYAAKHDRPEVCALLLEWGADPTAKHGRCSTPLHFAAGFGSLRCIEVLLDSHAVSVDVTGGGKQTPLHFAVHNRHVACAKLLLSRGANPAAVSVWGTPLQMAANNSDAEMERFIRSVGGGSPSIGSAAPAAARPPSPLPRVAYSADPTLAPLEGPATLSAFPGVVSANNGSIALPLIVQMFPHLLNRAIYFNGAECGAILASEGIRHSDGSVYTTPTSFTRRLSGSRSSGWKQLSVIVERKHVPLWYYKNFYLRRVASAAASAAAATAQAAAAAVAAAAQQQAQAQVQVQAQAQAQQPEVGHTSLAGRISPHAMAFVPTGWGAGPTASSPLAKMPPMSAISGRTPGDQQFFAAFSPHQPLAPATAVTAAPAAPVASSPPGSGSLPSQAVIHTSASTPMASSAPMPAPRRPAVQGSPTGESPPGPVSILAAMRGAAKPPYRSFRQAGRIPRVDERDVERTKVKVGTSGSVYEGTLRTTRTKVLVKKFRAAELKGINPVAELEAHCILHHPHVLVLYGFYVDSRGRAFLLLEPVSRTLRQLLAENGNRPPPLIDAVEMAHGIARALKALYNSEDHHPLLGLTPDSVLLTPDSIPKICDFNLAEWLLGGKTTASSSAPARYRAPEMFADGAHPNEKADAYTFGMILYELLEGRQPFSELSDDEFLARRSKQTADSPTPLPSLPVATNYVTGHLTSLMTMCWRKQPALRPGFGQIVDVLDNLQPHIESLPFWTAGDRVQFICSVAGYLRSTHNEFTQALEESRVFLFGPDWRSALDAPLQALIKTERVDCTTIHGLVSFIRAVHEMARDGKLPADVAQVLDATDPDAILPYVESRVPGLVDAIYRILSKDDDAEPVQDAINAIQSKYSKS